ncbi:ABC transporter permease [Streptomyces sp. NBC_01351]|uniref:ABC transporter permease n=1 Tax=Streptomyces sp. NBC_01351 TaxID=2903833 RepID=UPI002E35F633|nr:ABC transporter permease [Streptomyces sp. NBC_01351]
MTQHTGHLLSLGRAELTVFLRSKSNLVNVLVVPAMITLGLKVVIDRVDMAAAGLSLGPVFVSTAAGVTLTMALYAPLVGVYVARREEHMLKRMRTGEMSDATILAGSALPATATALVQFALVATLISLVAGTGAPAAPHLALAGILLGALMMAVLAAATTAMARTVESAQLALLPGMFLLPLTSGTYFPLEALPPAFHDICRFLPLTPAIDLVRAGWTGGMSGGEAALAVLILLTWTALAAGAVRSWFRWETRT